MHFISVRWFTILHMNVGHRLNCLTAVTCEPWVGVIVYRKALSSLFKHCFLLHTLIKSIKTGLMYFTVCVVLHNTLSNAHWNWQMPFIHWPQGGWTNLSTGVSLHTHCSFWDGMGGGLGSRWVSLVIETTSSVPPHLSQTLSHQLGLPGKVCVDKF